MNIAYLSLGTNLGDREYYLWCAIAAMKNHPNISFLTTSSIYETEPVGYVDQGSFLNLVVKIQTNLSPEELLDFCLEVEQDLGRKRELKWGPRTIDLDILLYNHENRETEKLIIPHPRMHERAFVLIPLLELTPEITIPKMNIPAYEVLKTLPNTKGVQLWKQINGEDEYVLIES
ncbi:2-amino-4-hydroxy-6-hydroxymethyldihydropteridine pyrophosphokinase [Bacillus coahuilensis m2-6]|uniref:2-amino-4-hydroxy-6-hydroxymethyldihydropteridine diphosphokinase n=1 Tax=Bacillus coahuilensis p1.1.43 TaxID=1150625 RepID=A0A147K4U9_9BACI|nr:2-amino-4-hydroxy-6-hydroxymethyldihydropteridine diphosphokinase [Bacillus coahuilensis]KUP04199.1 2-amino-4-hydroxy-6-hydroxymethyldihydropteridine pyrophosphokinase [Bacillus coahuilensis m2-6]KUP04540.1 2-amino-4-hydroxy-6-hydroxymethyldihydropteridine pyrophosphokinase [Bacillus coahuilensis p1.1.43]